MLHVEINALIWC